MFDHLCWCFISAITSSLRQRWITARQELVVPTLKLAKPACEFLTIASAFRPRFEP